jgi:hypothetical protein
MRPAASGVAGRDAGASLPRSRDSTQCRRAPARPRGLRRVLHEHEDAPRPENPIRRGQTKPRRARAIQDRQLMPECEDLEVQSRARSSCRPKREDQRNDDGDHESSLFDPSATSIHAPLTMFLVGTPCLSVSYPVESVFLAVSSAAARLASVASVTRGALTHHLTRF